jgi:hypothetical protein
LGHASAVTSFEGTIMLTIEERIPDDLTQVNLAEDWEVRYWCARFDVDADELRACVMEVGPRVYDVDQRLKEAARKAFENTGED